jgi:outer membrane lipoprotein-sorting protein
MLLLAATALTQPVQNVRDPAAREILDCTAEKIRLLKSIQADFELVIEDRKEKTRNVSTGNLLIKQNKYRIISSGTTVYFNGKTMWTYTPDVKEVTITEPEKNEDQFLSNPTILFSDYNNDFKYKYIRETHLKGSTLHEIDLFPVNLKQPYSRIKLFVNTGNHLPEMIKSIGKDGIDYTVTFKNMVTDSEIDDAAFVFDQAAHKKVEVIDLRGTK